MSVVGPSHLTAWLVELHQSGIPHQIKSIWFFDFPFIPSMAVKDRVGASLCSRPIMYVNLAYESLRGALPAQTEEPLSSHPKDTVADCASVISPDTMTCFTEIERAWPPVREGLLSLSFSLSLSLSLPLFMSVKSSQHRHTVNT